MSNATGLDVMRYALQQYAYKESPAGTNKTKFGRQFGLNGQPWCAIFSWCSGENAPGANPFAKSASAADIQDLTVRNKGGKYILKRTSSNKNKKNTLPNVRFGDSISFNFNGGTSRAHTALVVGRWHNYIYCIEGNTSFGDKGSQNNGGCVALRERFYTTGVCIVRPNYGAWAFPKPTTAYSGNIPSLPARGWFKYGDKSGQVAYMQQALSWANGYKLASDGDYGSCTFAEVVIFQVANGLEPDGEFGEKCLAKLKELITTYKSAPQNVQNKPQTDEKPIADTNINNKENAVKSSIFPERGWWQKGDKDERIKDIQRNLNRLNYMAKIPKDKQVGIYKQLVVDGDFGVETERHAKLFQFIENIDTDGQVGRITNALLSSRQWTGARGAVNFAVAVSLDNSFAYGTGSRAHRSGCYFCETNTGARKKKKEKKGEPHTVKDSKGKKHTYTKTYCCNPFITAAYAHGAGDDTIYKICNKGSSCGMSPGDWTKSKKFKLVGNAKNVAYSSLKMGDVVLANKDKGAKTHHVFMCIGNGRFVHASGGTWSSSSISCHGNLKSKYKEYQNMKGTNVVRYEG